MKSPFRKTGNAIAARTQLPRSPRIGGRRISFQQLQLDTLASEEGHVYCLKSRGFFVYGDSFVTVRLDPGGQVAELELGHANELSKVALRQGPAREIVGRPNPFPHRGDVEKVITPLDGKSPDITAVPTRAQKEKFLKVRQWVEQQLAHGS